MLSGTDAACECKGLYVRPEARGRGVASLLMDAAEGMGEGEECTWIYLDTKQTFHAAIALYQSLGYTLCEPCNDNPEAALLFRNRLS